MSQFEGQRTTILRKATFACFQNKVVMQSNRSENELAKVEPWHAAEKKKGLYVKHTNNLAEDLLKASDGHGPEGEHGEHDLQTQQSINKLA